MSDDLLLVADLANNEVRRVQIPSGSTTSVPLDLPAAITDIAMCAGSDPANPVWLAVLADNQVRKFVGFSDPTGEPYTSAEAETVHSVACSNDYVAFCHGSDLRVKTLVGNGQVALLSDTSCVDVAFSPAGSHLALALDSVPAPCSPGASDLCLGVGPH